MLMMVCIIDFFAFCFYFKVNLSVSLGDVCLDTPAVAGGKSWHVGSYLAELGNMLVDVVTLLLLNPTSGLELSSKMISV